MQYTPMLEIPYLYIKDTGKSIEDITSKLKVAKYQYY